MGEPSATQPDLRFTTPRTLPDPRTLAGRVVVLDIAFAAEGMGTPFEEVTLPFIRELGSRLAAWIDHHDHERQADFRDDPRFHLATKAQHGACPEMVTPAIVHETGPVGTILTHVDLDGLYAAAKWLLDGAEPYPGADEDARKVDTRQGEPGPVAKLIDHALRAHFRDDALKHRIVHYLTGGLKDREHRAVIQRAADDFAAMAAESERLARQFEMRGHIAYVDAESAKTRYDKTSLLLLGQKRAPVAIVRDSGMITLAAEFSSGISFVELLGLGGGMPTRVSLPEARLDEAIEKINQLLDRSQPRARTPAPPRKRKKKR
ncbi:MAG TPA: hypothetical protein VKN99_18830 [Polyangia bacterium]|nr:hypothetical protein [Polyangia bacterium]